MLELPLVVRLGLLMVLILFTFWYSMRGLQNGILLFLFTTMWRMLEATLFRAEGSLPNVTLERVVGPIVLLVFLLQWRKGKIKWLRLDFIEWCMVALIVAILLSMYVFQTYSASP